MGRVHAAGLPPTVADGRGEEGALVALQLVDVEVLEVGSDGRIGQHPHVE